MGSVTIYRQLSEAQRQQIVALVALAEAAQGFRPLSDDAWIALQQPTAGPYAMLIDDQGLVGVAHLGYGEGACSCEVVVRPGADVGAVTGALLSAVELPTGASLHWWAFAASEAQRAVAAALGLEPRRQLLQMCRSLPTGHASSLVTRSFVPGADDAEWLRVNNRAFAWHDEQRGWTADTLHQRMAQDWFDPSGFLIHQIDGRMAGFCWTKLHTRPPVGEIYVIAADPDFAGRGLGTALTLAGLDWLAKHGVSTGMLFVDGDNTAAVRMYERLGFAVQRTDTLFSGRPS